MSNEQTTYYAWFLVICVLPSEATQVLEGTELPRRSLGSSEGDRCAGAGIAIGTGSKQDHGKQGEDETVHFETLSQKPTLKTGGSGAINHCLLCPTVCLFEKRESTTFWIFHAENILWLLIWANNKRYFMQVHASEILWMGIVHHDSWCTIYEVTHIHNDYDLISVNGYNCLHIVQLKKHLCKKKVSQVSSKKGFKQMFDSVSNYDVRSHEPY